MTKKKHQISGKKVISESLQLATESPIFIPLFFSDPKKKRQIVWELLLENGERIYGKAKKNAISIQSLCAGEHHLTVIVGMPILFQKHRIYKSTLIVKNR